MSQEKDLYDLIRELCNVDQIKDVLREYKRDATKEVKKDLRVTGNQEDVIQNLKEAVAHGHIPVERVHSLLRESEENGDQHVFYFVPRTKRTEKTVQDGEGIAQSLWGKNWERTMKFPRFTLVPNESQWADFRPDDVGGKSTDWLGKVYRLERRKRFREERTEGKQIVEYYDIEDERVVFVVRWNQPNLLEIRIHRTENTSRKSMQGRLQAIWALLKDAINREDFAPWPVTEITRKMLKAYSQRQNTDLGYEPADTTLMSEDGGGATLHCPDAEGGSLFAAQERRDAIESFLHRNAVCRQSVIVWLEGNSGGILNDRLRMIVGGHEPNQIIIQPRVGSRVIDYVTNQLRNFDR